MCSKTKWHWRALAAVSSVAKGTSSAPSPQTARRCMASVASETMFLMVTCPSSSKKPSNISSSSSTTASARRAPSATPSAAVARTEAGQSKAASVRTDASRAMRSARTTMSSHMASGIKAADERRRPRGTGPRPCRSSHASMRSAAPGFGSTSSTKPRPSSRGNSKPTTLSLKPAQSWKPPASSNPSRVNSWTSSILHAKCTQTNMSNNGSNSMGERTAKKRW
mmetsp:Transcript_72120/g.167135  ORF Transcript_72120/g.167135 Transcript_72120/m.167135 type:complete len:223 (-) Transcript_72120:314-982(-)